MGRPGIGGLLVIVLAASCGDDDDATSATAAAQPTTTVATTGIASTAPEAPATIPAEWSTYDSTRFEYSIKHPDDWVVTTATADWPGSGFPFPNGSSVDRFGPSETSTMWIFASSVDLEQGKAAAVELDQENQIACELSAWREIEVAGREARQQEQFCFGKDHLVEVQLKGDDRFYVLDIISSAEITDTELAIFQAMLDSFQFT